MVKFAEHGAVVVGGSDHGCVYVFNINDPEPAQVLYHEKADSMIQTVAVSLSSGGVPCSQQSSRPFRPWKKTS